MSKEVECRHCHKPMSPGSFPVCQKCWDTVALTDDDNLIEQVGAGIYCPECHGDDNFLPNEELKCKNLFHRNNREPVILKTPREELIDLIAAELDHAYTKHGREPWGRHEFYAVLLEEVDELWEAIKHDDPQERVIAELKQVAAMCFRYFETGDKYRGPHNGA